MAIKDSSTLGHHNLILPSRDPQSKMAAASTPQAPAAPCTAKASMGSSICYRATSREDPTWTSWDILRMSWDAM